MRRRSDIRWVRRFVTKTGSVLPSSWPISPPRKQPQGEACWIVSTTCGTKSVVGQRPVLDRQGWSGGTTALLAAVDRLGSGPPSSVQGIEVTGMTDYRLHGEERPMWLGEQDLIELALGDRGRVLVRPSGTAKLKIYVDLSHAVDTNHDAAHQSLLANAQSLAEEVGEWLEV